MMDLEEKKELKQAAGMMAEFMANTPCQMKPVLDVMLATIASLTVDMRVMQQQLAAMGLVKIAVDKKAAP